MLKEISSCESGKKLSTSHFLSAAQRRHKLVRKTKIYDAKTNLMQFLLAFAIFFFVFIISLFLLYSRNFWRREKAQIKAGTGNEWCVIFCTIMQCKQLSSIYTLYLTLEWIKLENCYITCKIAAAL